MVTAWFKKKDYGYGWVPVTWQGWLVVWLYVAVIVAAGAYLFLHPGPESLIRFGIWLVCWSLVLFAVCRSRTSSHI